MSGTFKYDVFLSHSSKDKVIICQLAERLRADGLRVWLDEWEIKPGDSIGLRIEKGLESSRILVLAMSADAFASDWVTLERHTALFRDPTNVQRRFVPLRLDDTEIKDVLKQYAYIDWRERSEEQYAKLLRACQRTLDATKPASKQLPRKLRSRLRKAVAAFDLGEFDKARKLFESARKLADDGGHVGARLHAETNLALILWHWKRNPIAAKELLEKCLDDAREPKFETERANILFQLGTVMGVLGDPDQAENLLKKALELDRRLGRKLNEAGALVQLAWEIGHRGKSQETLRLNKQALDCFIAVYRSAESEDEEDAIRGISQCYFQQAMVHKREGSIEEAEAALITCLEWQRKLKKNHELAKILRELAGLKFSERDLEQGCQYLKEAAEIYRSLDHGLEEARCLDLMARVLFTCGQRREASTRWMAAVAAAEKAKDDEETARFSHKLGLTLLDYDQVEEARALFEKSLSITGSSSGERARSLVALAEIAEKEKNDVERDSLLKEAIQTLKKSLSSVKVPPKRAKLYGDIGSYYVRLKDYPEALRYFQKAKKVFESLPHLRGIAETWGAIAHLKGLLGRVEEEREAYKEIRNLLEGTSNHDLTAAAEAGLAEIEMRYGDPLEAKRLLVSAESLCRKHHLPFLEHVVLSLDHVEAALDARKLPELRIEELIDELYEQLRLCPANKDGLLRYWTFSRSRAILGNIRGSLGLYLMIIEDSLGEFQTLAKKLKAFVDWSFLAVPTRFPEEIQDVIPMTGKMRIFSGTSGLAFKNKEDQHAFESLATAVQEGRIHRKDLNLPDQLRYSQIAKGGTLPRYFWGKAKTTESDKSKGSLIAGWSPALPVQVHQLVFKNSADDLKKTKSFFIYYNRKAVKQEAVWDLRLGKEFRIFPVYRRCLPKSEHVQLVAAAQIKLPIMSVSEKKLAQELRSLKRDVLELMSCTKEDAVHLLNRLSSAAADLSDKADSECIDLQICLLEWSDNLSHGLHPAIVVNA